MIDCLYGVTITKQEEAGGCLVTWRDLKTGIEESFVTSSKVITETDLKLWVKGDYRLPIGQKLYRFLDGANGYLTQVLTTSSRARKIPVIYITTCGEMTDWPFELIARGEEFLCISAVHVIRCVSLPMKEIKQKPKNRPLKMLFMASSAINAKPELDFEKEEETIFEITKKLAIDMEVEDSGSLEGLREKISKESYDVVHLSGHAGINKEGKPFFVMEDETGYGQEVSPARLWHEGLIENPPRLVFLSGCRTGETKEGDGAVSFCRELVEKYNIPAVLGWGNKVSDSDAIIAGKYMYHELSRGNNLLEAVSRARYEIVLRSNRGKDSDWPLLRLFGNMRLTENWVQKEQKILPKPRRLTHTYLGNSRVKVLVDGFVGRRRPLQRGLVALKKNRNKLGVAIFGLGGLGKSCLAGKICERFKSHYLVIVHGKLNAISLHDALEYSFTTAQDEKGKQVLAEKLELTEKLEKLCVSSFREKNYVILLDDFEQNLEGYEKGEPEGLIPEAAVLLRVLLNQLPGSGKNTQMIITSRYQFTLEENGVDGIAERLEPIYLTRFLSAEQDKKVLGLVFISRYPDGEVRKELIEAGCGNPRLMEWLDVLVGEMGEAEVAYLMELVKGKKEEFIQEHVLRELMKRGGLDFGTLLTWLSIYRRPVLMEGVKRIGERVGIVEWARLLERGVATSLMEFYQVDSSYGVTDILRHELVSQIVDPELGHRVGFDYYKWLKEEKLKNNVFDPMEVEELVNHALGCGEEENASSEGSELVKYLRERLAYYESQRVGDWILFEKRTAMTSGNDALLLNSLALVTWILGAPRKAISYYEQAQAIWKKVDGEDHQNFATSCNNLGGAYSDLGEKEIAIGYFEQALPIWKKVYGEDHPSMATTLNNLGSTYKALGEFQKAIYYYEQALIINEKVYGKEHPNVAIRLNNLGLTYSNIGQKEKAMEYYMKAIAIWQKAYGEEHPYISVALNNIGGSYSDLGEKAMAIGYYEQALSIDEKVYGKTHPSVARDLNNMALTFLELDEFSKAILYCERALAIWKKTYGEEHPNIASTLSNLGMAYLKLGQKNQALIFLEESYSLKLKFFGKDHHSSIKTKEKLDELSLILGEK